MTIQLDDIISLAKAIRVLAIDAVEQAQSGHPGMPLGMADIATVLWTQRLKHNPLNPAWFNRDRFVLSNGHGCMLWYALLHLTGYKLSIDDLKKFRQLHSKTPGHPEFGETPGVESTAGPLGQGLGCAVGMAIAEKHLAALFNRPEFPLVDHYTYAFVGDGCLMEGVSHEVCSLAGTLQLGKLIVFYDDNGISIDGPVQGWFTEDVALRFQAYGWHVVRADGHSPAQILRALDEARQEHSKPSLLMCKTIIGKYAPNAGSESTHGAPLGAEGVKMAKQAMEWLWPAFEIPAWWYEHWDHKKEGQKAEDAWLQLLAAYAEAYPEENQAFLRWTNGDLPDNWDAHMQGVFADASQMSVAEATRKSAQYILGKIAPCLPEMIGGSADLRHSNNTDWSGSVSLSAEHPQGNYLSYGVREFGMATIMNGMALHGGVIPYGGTFLVFSDYARNAMRLSALMKQRVIYILTHDSIGLGEDGPTHQPIEHASMLRTTPNMEVWRPASRLETAAAWQSAVERERGPTCLLLTRQALPVLPHTLDMAPQIARGAYILQESEGALDAIIMATGSEVALACQAADQLHQEGYGIRVVSMPCCERFLAQEEAYREAILPASVRRRIAVEAASSNYWYRFVGLDGIVLGIDRFGWSAPAAQAFEAAGITVETIIQAVYTLC
ncbi:MAG: transketolase [Legionellaceae bacterium]|nr:transketolase [Legionellaceae bacterium]